MAAAVPPTSGALDIWDDDLINWCSGAISGIHRPPPKDAPAATQDAPATTPDALSAAPKPGQAGQASQAGPAGHPKQSHSDGDLGPGKNAPSGSVNICHVHIRNAGFANQSPSEAPIATTPAPAGQPLGREIRWASNADGNGPRVEDFETMWNDFRMPHEMSEAEWMSMLDDYEPGVEPRVGMQPDAVQALCPAEVTTNVDQNGAGPQAVAIVGPDNVVADHVHDRVNMMYVSGETGEPSAETTGLIEEIVRQQVIELLRTSTELAARRGSRAITINDLIFQIRHDQAKVSRLRTFLSWKDVRKNVRESDDKVGDADLGAAAGDDPMGGAGAGGVGGGAPASIDGPDGAKKNRKAKVGLPWEPASFYGHDIPDRMGGGGAAAAGGGGDDDGGDDDGDEEEMNYITLQRLRKADERTRDMTRDEYVTWSEYRQASFTYRKAKRFREWAGFGVVTDSKPSDDIIDILGFLTFEMVQTLTETALRIKEQEDTWRGAAATAAAAAAAADNKVGRKKPYQIMSTLFSASPSSAKAPIEPRHIQEAYRRLQRRDRKYGAMLNGTMLPQTTPLRIF